MTGKHTVGRHRSPNDTGRNKRVAQVASVVSALLVLGFAFYRPTQTVSNAKPMPAPSAMDLSVSRTTTTAPTPSSSTTKKKPQRETQRPRRTSVTQDQTHTSVTPGHRAPIKSERTLSAIPRPPPEKDAAPVESESPVVNRQQVPTSKLKPAITSSKSVPAAANASTPKVKTTPRVVPSTVQRVTPATQRKLIPKPQTISPVRPVVPIAVSRVTSNAKCANIGLQPTPKTACNRILAAFPQIKTVLGVGNRAGNAASCHPRGLAIDFMVGTNKALGDRLYAYVIAQRSALGASPVVLWQVPSHFDHVHVSFNPCKG